MLLYFQSSLRSGIVLRLRAESHIVTHRQTVFAHRHASSGWFRASSCRLFSRIVAHRQAFFRASSRIVSHISTPPVAHTEGPVTYKNATKAAPAKAGEPQGTQPGEKGKGGKGKSKGTGIGGSKGKSADSGGKGKGSGAADKGGQTKGASLFYPQGLCRRGPSCCSWDTLMRPKPHQPLLRQPQTTKAQPAAKPKTAVAKAAVAMLALSGALHRLKRRSVARH